MTTTCSVERFLSYPISVNDFIWGTKQFLSTSFHETTILRAFYCLQQLFFPWTFQSRLSSQSESFVRLHAVLFVVIRSAKFIAFHLTLPRAKASSWWINFFNYLRRWSVKFENRIRLCEHRVWVAAFNSPTFTVLIRCFHDDSLRAPQQ